MDLVDWRELSPEAVAPLYADQASAWSSALGWDLSVSWAAIERARAAGALPGLVCRTSADAIAAWTFFLRQGDVLQIGALVGAGATPVRMLLEAILDSPEAAGARELTCLLYPARPNAMSALSRRRFQLEAQRYLSRDLNDAGAVVAPDVLPAELVARRWLDDDAVACVRLLERAYAGEHSGRALAPNGTLEEWAAYLGQVLKTPACGILQPHASVVIEERSTLLPVGFILVTRVGPRTAHIAQIAVDPRWRGRGAGRTLVGKAAKAAAAAGLDRLTLLVADENDRAARLHSAEGFAEVGQLVFAHRRMPVRRQHTVRSAATARVISDVDRLVSTSCDASQRP